MFLISNYIIRRTKDKLAIKNNIEKFPERYSWKLTNEEVNVLRSKFLTAKINNMSRSLPRVFIEQGVAVLSLILKSKVAIQISIIKNIEGI